MSSRQAYTLALGVPYLVARAVAWTLTAPLESAGATVSVSSGTCTVLRPDGTTLVSAAAATIGGGVASYALTVPAAETYGRGYEVRWALTVSGVVYTVSHPLVVAEQVPLPTVSHTHLYRYCPELQTRLPPAQETAGTGWQPQLDAAYEELTRRLLDQGQPLQYLRSVDGAHEWLLRRALVICLLAIDAGQELHQLHQIYRVSSAQFRDADTALRLVYSDLPTVARGAPVVALGPPPGRW